PPVPLDEALLPLEVELLLLPAPPLFPLEVELLLLPAPPLPLGLPSLASPVSPVTSSHPRAPPKARASPVIHPRAVCISPPSVQAPAGHPGAGDRSEDHAGAACRWRGARGARGRSREDHHAGRERDAAHDERGGGAVGEPLGALPELEAGRVADGEVG